MAIPVFTGAARITESSPPNIQIPQLDPAAYAKGALAAKEIGAKSDLALVADALTQGLETYNRFEQQEQLSELRGQQIEQNELTLQREKAEAVLDPLKTKAQISLVNAQAFKQAADAEEIIQGVNFQKETLAKKGAINGIFSSIKEGNVAEGLEALDANFDALMEVGVYLNPKNGKLIADPVITNNVANLYTIAKKTGNPELIAKATEIANNYRTTVRNIGPIGQKEGIALPGEEQTNEVSAQTYTDFVYKRNQVPELVNPPPKNQTNAPMGAPSISGTPVSPAPRGSSQYAAPAVSALTPTAPPLISSEGLPPPPPSLGGVEDETPDKQAVDALLRDSAIPQPDKVDFFYQKNIAKGMTPYQADIRAQQQVKNMDLNVTNEEQLRKLGSGFTQVQKTAQNARSTMTRFLDLMKKGNISAEDGATQPMEWYKAQLLAATGLSDDDKELVNDVYKSLDAIGFSEAINTVSTAQLGTQLMNTPLEADRIKALSFGSQNTLERNLQALEMLEGKTEDLDDSLRIIDSMRQTGFSYEDATRAARQFITSSPSTFIGEIDGQPYVRRNQKKASPDSFILDKTGGRQSSLRKEDGRAITSEPVDPKFFSQNFKYDPSALASDIPDKLPNGANAALLQRMIKAESGGREGRTSSAGAEGLMQLMPATGKELWQQAGYSGPYDPHDRAKNINMGTKYINYLLGKYNGDTRVALAAYNYGLGNVDVAYKAALTKEGKTDWATVQMYLPKGLPEETEKYVKNIMGDDGTLQKESPAPRGQDLGVALASLKTENAQNNARAFLAPEGLNELNKVAQAKTVAEVQGTSFGNAVMAMLSPAEAQAETPDGEAPAAPSAEDSGLFGDIAQFAGDTLTGGMGNAIGKAIGREAGEELPGNIQSLALGVARTALFGFDDEGGALFRMAMLGEDYETATKNTRAIRDKFQAENPKLYLAGEVGGSFLGPLTALKAGQAVIGGASKAVPAVAEVAKEAGALSTIGKGIVTGLAAGGAGGFGEGEGFGNRVSKAVTSGVIGGAAGGALGSVVAAGSKLLTSTPAKIAAQKVDNFITGENKDVLNFTKSQTEVLETIGRSPEKLKVIKETLQSTDNDLYRFLDDLGDAKTRQLAGAMLKDTDTAEAVIDFTTVRAAQTSDRLSESLSQHADDVAPEDAFTGLVQSVDEEAAARIAKRAADAEPLYDETRKSLPQIPTKNRTIKTESTVTAADDGSVLVDQYNRALTDGGITKDYSRIETPASVPGFTNKEVAAAIKDPDIADAIERSRTVIDKGGVLDDRSFDLLQQTKATLYSDMQKLSGNARRTAAQAFTKLRSAMRKGSEDLAKADDVYYEGSQDINKFTTKFIQKLQRAAGDGETIDTNAIGKTLFSASPDVLKRTMDSVSPNTAQRFKNAAAAHIKNMVEESGAAGKFPNFQQKKFGEKLKAIYGDEAGADIIKNLAEESRMAKTSNVFATQGVKEIAKSAGKQETVDRQVAQRAGEAISQTAAGAATGTGVLRGVYAAVKGIQARITGSKLKADEALSKELAKVLLLDKEGAISFINEILEKAATQDNEMYQFLDDAYLGALKLIQPASKAGSQVLSAESNLFEPQSNAARREQRSRK